MAPLWGGDGALAEEALDGFRSAPCGVPAASVISPSRQGSVAMPALVISSIRPSVSSRYSMNHPAALTTSSAAGSLPVHAAAYLSRHRLPSPLTCQACCVRCSNVGCGSIDQTLGATTGKACPY